jgi:hypothetical protein
MGLTLVTSPIPAADAYELFAGFQKIEYIFKREDLVVTSVTAGTGGAKITVATDLTTYLAAGDVIYLYSPGTNYVYDLTATILTITATEITVDAPYIETGTGGYINYLKNYFVEMQCVHPANDDINLLPFSLECDGDAAGNIKIDVSIMNDLNVQRGIIATAHLATSKQEFEVTYRQVYTGSSEAFTLLDNKLHIVLYATEMPEKEVILNGFDMPQIYLGYPGAVVVAHGGGVDTDDIEMTYKELDANQVEVGSGSLSTLDSELNGFLMWKWLQAASVSDATKYIQFEYTYGGTFDFRDPDFAYPDFRTQ